MVGESGCGKSITALSIMRLISPPGKIVGGEILFDGRNLLKLSEAEMRQIRGDDIGGIAVHIGARVMLQSVARAFGASLRGRARVWTGTLATIPAEEVPAWH